jgi:hypothetical protein
MYGDSEVNVTKVEKLVVRPGFGGRFHRVTFVWLDGGLVDSSFQVWVPSTYPEADVERVARTFLWRRLLDFAELSKAGALAEQEMGATRQRRAGSQRVGKARHNRQSSLRPLPSHIESARIRISRYVLDDCHEPVPCDDLVTWKAWMETPERWVQNTLVSDPAENQVRICTVFLGIDVGFGVGKPILFETMVLGGMCDRELYRYCTWDEAQAGHAAILERMKAHDRRIASNPTLLKARDLAHRTVENSGQNVVIALIEQTANHPAR